MLTHYDMSHTGQGQHLGYWKTGRANDPSDLPWPEDFIDFDWDLGVRDAVLAWMEAQQHIQSWRGYSWCRICGFGSNGTTDMSDGTYVWPEGLLHYIREHGVRPPQEFIDHALGRRPHDGPIPKPTKRLPSMFRLPDWMQEGAVVKVAHTHTPGSAMAGHKTLSEGTEVIIEYFDGPDVTVATFTTDDDGQVEEQNFYTYSRMDFHWMFGGDRETP